MTVPMVTRIRLLEKPEVDTSLRAGDDGDVVGYDTLTGQLHVKWDNGSRLPVPPNIVYFMEKTCTSAAMN